MLRTWLTERFGLTVPVVSAPMAGVSGGRLAAAVSTAGALGTIGFGAATADQVREHARVAAASGRPFGIGLLAWTEPGDDVVEAIVEANPALVSVSYGDCARYLDRFKAAGIAVTTQAGTSDDARAAVDLGVDVVVARGGEGGGHGRDSVATLPLLQAVLDAVDVPVLAAGGIATARGVAAVLAAGAAGAWVGTAFTVCPEAEWSAQHRATVVDTPLDGTIYTTVLDIARGSAWPREFGGRAVRSSFAETWHGREDELRRDPVRSDEPIVWTGQAAGLVHRERAAADVVADLAGAEALLAEVCTSVTGG